MHARAFVCSIAAVKNCLKNVSWKERSRMMGYTNDIVSTFSYLIGIDKKYFREEELENTFASIEIYNRLEHIKSAKIVRSLCLIRNGFMNNFGRILVIVNDSGAGIHGLYDYVDKDAITYLESAGIKFKYQSWAANYITEANRYLSDRVNNCKTLFPDFIEWDYLRELFLMPDGATYDGCKAGSDVYYANKTCYPFSCYMNWKLICEERGKSLYNDYLFLRNLYEDNKDTFDRQELVSDNSENNKNTVSEFLLKGDVEIIIDCENANPFFIYSFLNAISSEECRHISRVIMFNDLNASTAWEALPKRFDDIEFEEVLCDRMLERKSMVDVRLISRTMKEYYEENIRSFILVSSDSDFYGLIEELPNADFMLVVQRKMSSSIFRETARSSGISYIYSEDYPYSEAYDFIKSVMKADFKKTIKEKWSTINLLEEVESICQKTYAKLTDAEKTNIIKTIIRNLKIEVDDEYNAKIVVE